MAKVQINVLLEKISLKLSKINDHHFFMYIKYKAINFYLICVMYDYLLVPNPETEKFITESYRKILKRDPDTMGFFHYLKEIEEARLTKEQFIKTLNSSEEYHLMQARIRLQLPSEKGDIIDITSLDLSKINSQDIEKNLSRLHDYLLNCQIIPGPKEELRTYLEEAFYRFVKTLQLIPVNSQGRILEIGSNPYFLSILLKKFRKLDWFGSNFFSTPTNSISQTVVNEKYVEQYTFESKLFNIENDTFPFPDEHFDYVLFCEVIEHLIKDPIHALKDVHRVLKPNGTLILTTPNVARYSNIQKLQKGENIYDPYSKYGIYGRHNREYTVKELSEIINKIGFKLDMIFTNSVHFKMPENKWWQLFETENGGGDYIFVSAKKKGKFCNYQPSWLYR